jgi:hypothetical protein
MEKTYEVWGIHEAVELAEAADKLGLKVVLTRIDKRLFGVDGGGKEYIHQNYGYRVTVYWGEDN